MGLDVSMATCNGHYYEHTQEHLKIELSVLSNPISEISTRIHHMTIVFVYVISCILRRIEIWKNSIVRFHPNITIRLKSMMVNELKSKLKHFTILLSSYDKDLLWLLFSLNPSSSLAQYCFGSLLAFPKNRKCGACRQNRF